MSDFASLKKEFHGDLVTPDHPDYEASLARWAANSQRRAAVVAFVKDADDVRAALLYARALNLRIAVRGGGHNPAGSSSIEGGLVIDLSRYLAGVKVDVDKRLAYVGGGALWSTVNTECAKHGLVMPGGTISHTGVGGLTLGGGFGYLTGQYGLVIDNLEQATVTLASGITLTASAHENQDLFWGLRGGGSNFGVVTEFVFRVHPHAPNVFAGMLVLVPDALETVARIIERKWDAGMLEKEMYHLLIATGPGNMPCITLILFWDGSEEEGRAHFKEFFDLGPMIIADMCRDMPYVDVNSLQDAGVPHGRNYYFKSVNQPRPNPATVLAARDTVFALQKEHPDVLITFVFENWSMRKVCSIPNESTAFQRSMDLTCLVALTYEHNTPEGLREVRAISDALTGVVAAHSGVTNGNVGYANYNSDAPSVFDANTDVVLSARQTEVLFGSGHARLREIKKKYDPDMVFAKWFAIRPAT
ncbi:FAD-binding domain-containing protein [Artomyces pyxidatus]|uniref:FAD-binding domain-containing protein n=1 Tax=Artomyces pyxidatus TaxID=48021 RepID=A0ACB8T3W8_9AGAM|nr:FAD-binding domain-containing protein [Artomyces pyxidatus]